MSSPSLPLRFICLWRSRSKEGKKKEDQKKHLCLFEEQEIQSETEEEQQNLKPKEDPKTLKKNLITIETIYQSLLTYLKETIRKLPGKQNKPLKSNCSLLKLETWNRSLWKKRKTNIKKSKLRLLSIWNSQCLQKQNEVCLVLENKKEKKIEEKRKKYEVQLTRNYKRKV